MNKQMNRLMLCVAVLLGTTLSASAQISTETDHSMEFVDADGNIVADGSVIYRTSVEENDYGEPQISSGLYAKNTSDKVVRVAVQITMESLPSGKFQHCYPGSCKVTESPQTDYCYTQGPQSAKAGTQESLQSEWLVEEGKYGTCTVNYQFKIYEIDPTTWAETFHADGPSITVNYVYSDPAGIEANVAEKKACGVTYHDLSGRRAINPAHGVYVKKTTYADGTVETSKVIKK